MYSTINTSIESYRTNFNKYFKNLLKSYLTKNELSKAMIYGTLNGGKRIRPFLIRTFSEIVNIPKKSYYRLSAAVECIHSYSLIHDDLPCMDDDDYRRGKLSVHKKFNEAQAILAGDSLHGIAFEILSNNQVHKDANIRIKLVKLLSEAVGVKGLAGGQFLDLSFENKKINKSKILEMYNLKTAALFRFCCMAPFIMTNQSKQKINFAKNYGETFGLIFQIIDDYIDEIGNYKILGKTPGKDKKKGKSTLLKHLKKNTAIDFCESKANKLFSENKKFFILWEELENLLKYIIQRKS